jgi:hypothetical protein
MGRRTMWQQLIYITPLPSHVLNQMTFLGSRSKTLIIQRRVKPSRSELRCVTDRSPFEMKDVSRDVGLHVRVRIRNHSCPYTVPWRTCDLVYLLLDLLSSYSYEQLSNDLLKVCGLRNAADSKLQTERNAEIWKWTQCVKLRYALCSERKCFLFSALRCLCG